MQDTADRKVSSWTGFNILVRDSKCVRTDTLGYAPTIKAPATETSAVQEILQWMISFQSSILFDSIAVVFDQALFRKATEVAWQYPKKFGWVVLMMGNFHTICNLLSIIGKMFGDAGLRDLAVELGVIAEGSINKVLERKQYKRNVCLKNSIWSIDDTHMDNFRELAWKQPSSLHSFPVWHILCSRSPSGNVTQCLVLLWKMNHARGFLLSTKTF